MTERKFDSVHEEMGFYKCRFLEIQQEFEEYQQGSRELELEMEIQLSNLEKENADLKRNLQKVKSERDVYAEKLAFGTNEIKEQLEILERELLEEKELNEKLASHIRQLEQDNDDLERAKRVLTASLEEFERNGNQALERNAFLENELDEKEELSCMVQRLKEETNDLRRELAILSRQERPASFSNTVNGNTVNVNTVNGNTVNGNAVSGNAVSDNAVNGNSATGQQWKRSPLDSSHRGSAEDALVVNPRRDPNQWEDQQLNSLPLSIGVAGVNPRKPINPHSRSNALNIVNDLLKRVGELESKMATAQFCM